MTNDPALIDAIATWLPRGPLPPSVDLESRPDGLRVKLTYLGVESGVLFDWTSWGSPEGVRRTLDRLYEILSWRVIVPPVTSGACSVGRRPIADPELHRARDRSRGR